MSENKTNENAAPEQELSELLPSEMYQRKYRD